MTFPIDPIRISDDLEKRVSRLETLEEAGAATGGFWTLIEEQILTDNAQTVITFDNIDQSFETIVFLISARWYDGGGSSPLRMRWNDKIKYPSPSTNGIYCWGNLQNATNFWSFIDDYIELGDMSSRATGSVFPTLFDIFTTMVAYIPDYHRDDGIHPVIWHAGGYKTADASAAEWINGRGFGTFEIDGAGTDFRSDPLTKITFGSWGGTATHFGINSKFSLYGFGAAS